MKPRFFTKTTITIISILAITQVNAQVLGSLQFNGNDNYVEVINSPMNTIGMGDFTLEAWVKGDESEQTPHPMIFSNRGTSSSAGGMLFFFHDLWGGSQSKMLCVQIDEINHKFVDNGTYNGSLLDNKCHHVAIAKNKDTLYFYADGVLFGTRANTSPGSISFNEPLWIGKDKATNNTFNGIISQCRIWNITRTESEIFENKDISLQGNETGLIAYWEMNDGTDQKVTDKTNQFDGQLGSSAGIDARDPIWSEDGCVDAPTSTNNFEAMSIKVYPNPTVDFVMIEQQNNESIQLEFLDQTGKLLFSKTVNTRLTKIGLSKYAAGIYFINIISKENVFTQKVVKH